MDIVCAVSVSYGAASIGAHGVDYYLPEKKRMWLPQYVGIFSRDIAHEDIDALEFSDLLPVKRMGFNRKNVEDGMKHAIRIRYRMQGRYYRNRGEWRNRSRKDCR